MNTIQSEYLIIKSGTEQWKYSNFLLVRMELLGKTEENFFPNVASEKRPSENSALTSLKVKLRKVW